MKLKYDKGIKLVFKYISKVFPEVDKNLEHWSSLSINAGDDMLSTQAAASIRSKKFHCQGGSVYALYPGVNVCNTIKFIVSLQTISDYLDNLCDRAGVQDEASFRQLHLSMLDAVDPGRTISDYYLYYPYKKDNGYLKQLVDECRGQINTLPSYKLVVSRIKKYIELYSDLQSLKHLPADVRETRLTQWANCYLGQYPEISCWEFSAATGSTLGVFMLFAAAAEPSLTAREVDAIDAVYFPWVCSLHILLDYYIDAQEDMQMGDLNFTYYYKNLKHCEERLSYFIDRSISQCSLLKYPDFHLTVIKGLLATYLSDPKALTGMNRLSSQSLIKKGGIDTAFYHKLCRLLRCAGRM